MEFIAIAAAHFVALLSPGPDFFLIMQASLRLPRRSGLALCSGIAAANGVYALAAVLGLEIARDLPLVGPALRYLGGAYLVFLGFMLVKARRRSSLENQQAGPFLQLQGCRTQALIGFSAAIMNPKNAVFYLSLFTALVSNETGIAIRLVYAAWMTGLVWSWDSLLVMIIGRQEIRDRLGGSIFYLEKGSGIMLLFFGIMLPFA